MAFWFRRKRGPTVVGRLIDNHVGKDQLLPKNAPAELSKEIVPWTLLAPSGPLAALRCGDVDAPLVVLLPGPGGSKDEFHRLMLLLADYGYQSVAFDPAGHHESAGDALFAPHAYDWQTYSDDVEALLELTGPAHLLGVSFGGQVASLVAASRPELVESLSLVSVPPGHGNAYESVKWTGGMARHVAPRLIGAALAGARAVGARIAERMGERGPRKKFVKHNGKSVRDAYALMADAPNTADALANLDVPQLIAASTVGPWELQQHAQYAQALNAEAHFYRTAGHPHVSAPHQLARDLVGMLGEAVEKARHANIAA